VDKIGSREVGSAENARTRSYISTEITKIGLDYSEHQMSTTLRKPTNWNCPLHSNSNAISIPILPGLSTLPADLSGMSVSPIIYETKEDFENNPPKKHNLILVKLGALHESDMCRLASPAAAVAWFRDGYHGLYSGNCMRFDTEPLVPGFAVLSEDVQKLMTSNSTIDLKIEIAKTAIDITSLIIDIGDIKGHPCFITHFDSRRCSPGGNDNASGVACLLAVLSIWDRTKPARFVFFDGEEANNMGSRDYVKWLEAENKLGEISCVICPDSVGINELHIYTADRYGKLSEIMIASIRKAFKRQDWNVPDRVARSGTSDHASFNKVGIPCLFLSDFPNEVRHTTIDNLNRIDSNVLVRLADVFADQEFYADLCLAFSSKS
jgi:hypothetical protein